MSRTCAATNPPPAAAVDDRMLEPEFAAAEVLAGLSKSPKPPSSGESVDSWGSRGRRPTVRVKTESSPVDSALNSVTAPDKGKKPVLLAFDLNEDEGATLDQEEEWIFKGEDVELAEPTRVCTTSGGKPRHSLTEAEKEARKLRRVLANRESARQTIRRRQALYEDLNKKVLDLAQENENLKREKESAVKDYELLKSANKKLNEQVAGQFGSSLENRMPDDKGAPLGHWCVVPCPVFFPVPDAKNGPNLIPFFPTGDRGNETRVNNQPAGTSFPKPVASPKELPRDVKKEVSVPPQARIGKTTYEIPLGKSLECGRSPSDVIKEAMGVKLVSAPHSEAVSSKGFRDFSRLQEARKEPVVSLGNRDASRLQEARKEPVVSLGNCEFSSLQEAHKEPVVSLGKRFVVDPVAAAMARKRRKELTKLKGLHCRAHRKEGLRT